MIEKSSPACSVAAGVGVGVGRADVVTSSLGGADALGVRSGRCVNSSKLAPALTSQRNVVVRVRTVVAVGGPYATARGGTVARVVTVLVLLRKSVKTSVCVSVPP